MIVGITIGEWREYLQEGCIRIKDYPVSFRSHWMPGFRPIDFEGILEAYKLRTDLSQFGNSKRFFAAVEFGLIRVEDFGENYLLEVKEREFNDAVIDRLRKHGYEANEVGHFRLIDVRKKTR